MRRIAVLFDIHGNLPALEAVLADVRRIGVDLIVVGGDVVPGPMPAECLALLTNVGIPLRCVHGNGERDVIAAHTGAPLTRVPKAFWDGIRWCAATLSEAQIDEIDSWPRVIHLDRSPHSSVLVCHATPRDENEIITSDTSDEHLLALFGDATPLALCGHTHMQFERRAGQLRVLNAGSVGFPFGEPGAYWALLDGDEIQLRRLRYDLERAAQRIRDTKFPGAAAFASSCLEPPDAQAMQDTFRRAERRL